MHKSIILNAQIHHFFGYPAARNNQVGTSWQGKQTYVFIYLFMYLFYIYIYYTIYIYIYSYLFYINVMINQ